jgi:hypothetical protein
MDRMHGVVGKCKVPRICDEQYVSHPTYVPIWVWPGGGREEKGWWFVDLSRLPIRDARCSEPGAGALLVTGALTRCHCHGGGGDRVSLAGSERLCLSCRVRFDMLCWPCCLLASLPDGPAADGSRSGWLVRPQGGVDHGWMGQGSQGIRLAWIQAFVHLSVRL